MPTKGFLESYIVVLKLLPKDNGLNDHIFKTIYNLRLFKNTLLGINICFKYLFKCFVPGTSPVSISNIKYQSIE